MDTVGIASARQSLIAQKERIDRALALLDQAAELISGVCTFPAAGHHNGADNGSVEKAWPKPPSDPATLKKRIEDWTKQQDGEFFSADCVRAVKAHPMTVRTILRQIPWVTVNQYGVYERADVKPPAKTAPAKPERQVAPSTAPEPAPAKPAATALAAACAAAPDAVTIALRDIVTAGKLVSAMDVLCEWRKFHEPSLGTIALPRLNEILWDMVDRGSIERIGRGAATYFRPTTKAESA